MSQASPIRVTFVIPVRNDSIRLRRCLESIVRNDYPRGLVECIVADNGSTDDTAETARAMGATTLSIPGLPVSAVRNRAAAQASGDLIAFVDADHEIAPTWITAAVEGLREEDVGAVGALCLPPPDGKPVQGIYGVLRGRSVGRTNVTWLGSGNLAIRRDVFQQLGGFDERLETCEDVDLCQRLRAAGWRLVADERLVNIHLGDPASLWSVFMSERWRGRDNLRVSLRRMPALRDWPSIIIPVLDAPALVASVAGVAGVWFWGWQTLVVTAVAVAVLLGLTTLRAARMVVSGGLRRLDDVFLAFGVALAYDLGRACSLVLPAGHRQRQRSGPEIETGTHA